MKRFVTVGMLAMASVGLAAAQEKMTGTGTCKGKPEMQQAAEVGDRQGHSLALIKQTCTWSSPIEMAGLKGKSYTATLASDVAGGKTQDRGYVVVTMENGDKAFLRFQGTGAMDKNGAPQGGEGTWTYTGGTGKLKGLKGKGTYKSKPTGPDTTEDQVEGEYSLAAGK